MNIDWNSSVVLAIVESIAIIVAAFFLWRSLKKIVEKTEKKVDIVAAKLDEVPVDERMAALTVAIAKVIDESRAEGNVAGRAELKVEQQTQQQTSPPPDEPAGDSGAGRPG